MTPPWLEVQGTCNTRIIQPYTVLVPCDITIINPWLLNGRHSSPIPYDITSDVIN